MITHNAIMHNPKFVRRITRGFKRLYLFFQALRSIKRNRALSLFDITIREMERQVWAEKTLAKLKAADFLNNVPGNPALDVGSALQLATKYKLELIKGTCYGDCRAILDKCNWQHELDECICSFDYGTFMHKLPEEVGSIYAFGHSVQEAVCRCLLNCKTAGVL